MRNRLKLLLLVLLGAAVAGWGCALFSGNEQGRYEELQRDNDAKYAGLLEQFDTLAAAQQGTPDDGTLRQMYDLLIEADRLPSYGFRKVSPLQQRHETLANWGYASSQYWLGLDLDPCRHPALGRSRKSYLDFADRARYWYGKAAVQGMLEAEQSLTRLDNCKVPEQ